MLNISLQPIVENRQNLLLGLFNFFKFAAKKKMLPAFAASRFLG